MWEDSQIFPGKIISIKIKKFKKSTSFIDILKVFLKSKLVKGKTIVTSA